jgi:hypothetical protein
VDLEALAVVDEVYRMRLLKNFHALEQLLDEPQFVLENTLLDGPIKDELTERLAILTGPYEQMTHPKGRRPADEVEELLKLQNFREAGSPQAVQQLESAILEIDDIISPFLEVVFDETLGTSEVVRLLGVMELAGHSIVAHYKDKYKRPRPHVFDARINPAIAVPHHASYPSGHALQAHLMAAAMTEVFGDHGEFCGEFHDVADQIAANREFVGVHFPSDSAAGQIIAKTIFPLLRLLFDDLFIDALRSLNVPIDQDCDMSLHAQLQMQKPNYPAQSPLPVTPPAGSNLGNWHHQVIGVIDPKKQSDARFIAMLDTAVDVNHPALTNSTNNGKFINSDHPVPADDRFAMSSIGAGHGTAMAGVMVSSDTSWKGLTPSTDLVSARISSLLADTNDNRATLAATALSAAFFKDEDSAQTLLVAPPISAPGPTEFYKDLEEFVTHNELADLTSADRLAYVRTADLKDIKPICDVFVLSLMVISDLLPVVIPAGNNGDARLAHPADPIAYAKVKTILSEELGRALAIRYLEDIMFEPFDANLNRIAELTLDGYNGDELPDEGSSYAKYITTARSFTSEQHEALNEWLESIALLFPSIDDITLNPNADHFDKTGIIVVGAGSVMLKSDDRINLVTESGSAPNNTSVLSPTLYSQTGGGLCLIAPSNGRANYDPACHSADQLRPRAIPTADVFGYAGFADDPRALFSHVGQKDGFGGTSAAAAQVAAILAYLPENTAGPDARMTLIANTFSPEVPPSYDPSGAGYGQLRFNKEWASQ